MSGYGPGAAASAENPLTAEAPSGQLSLPTQSTGSHRLQARSSRCPTVELILWFRSILDVLEYPYQPCNGVLNKLTVPCFGSWLICRSSLFVVLTGLRAKKVELPTICRGRSLDSDIGWSKTEQSGSSMVLIATATTCQEFPRICPK